MPTVWQLLETIPGPAAVPTIWRASLGTDFDVFRDSFLRQLPTAARSYPCPRACGCAHEIVRHGTNEIVAVCRCDPCNCDDIPLKDADIVVLELNWSALGRAIASTLKMTAREADIGVRGTLQIAVTGNDSLPVVLVILNDRESFCQSVETLVARLRGHFMVVAPTADFTNASVQQFLSGANARFVPLNTSVRISDTGALIMLNTPAYGSEIGTQKNGWVGLRIGEIFEPRTMLWNSKPFVIEEPATCYKGYDLDNVSLESYFPDLHDNEQDAVKDIPFDEVENLRILRLVGGEKTLLIHVMLRDSIPVYPERLEISGETDGWHDGGVVVVDGQHFAIKCVHVEPTEPKVSARIQAARRARRPIDTSAVVVGAVSQVIEDTTGRTTLEAIHADLLETKELAKRIPEAIANVENEVKSMQPHVRGIPKVLEDLNEARLIPEDATRELFSRIQSVLTIEQQRIWTAVRRAGTQKGAIALLREQNLILSESTLSRRVHEIDDELAKHNLPPCKASGPLVRFNRIGGYENEDGKNVPEEIYAVDRDWADDDTERETTIRSYLAASSEEKAYFQQTKPGIDEESAKYLKRR